ncbi:DUF4044 domain-containing protein [Ligilactobacillus aviarius]|nr:MULTISPECIES: DUF4044 domain-containing protein [Ligilactobacillus]MBM6863326.1 DUF4044 domain-containing protein [Ligilactobacillus aviarius]MDM8277723.1 DUF4044 domain-containing protein [Ligilactobacillus aviarius]MDO3393009.1 DUF4044 domain-containing protein [Ligilactobacillus sp. 110_WCHN]
MAKKKKKKSTFQKVTMVVVWLMLIFTIGAVIFGAFGSLFNL